MGALGDTGLYTVGGTQRDPPHRHWGQEYRELWLWGGSRGLGLAPELVAGFKVQVGGRGVRVKGHPCVQDESPSGVRERPPAWERGTERKEGGRPPEGAGLPTD